MRMWLMLLGVPLLAQQLQVVAIPYTVVVDRLQRIARGDNEARLAGLRTLFAEAGCEVDEQKAKGSKLPNLVCGLGADAGADLILVTAHFDKVRAGAGVIDNWTGASL
jgi:acetylornithine deacetylase/succinyl-diaminopimelate desuccinylase-like protein